MPIDSNPGLFGSANGDSDASCNEHAPLCPAEEKVSIAIADGLPNSATYTPPPVPVWLRKPIPPRYDQLADSPLTGPEVQPPESTPVLLSK